MALLLGIDQGTSGTRSVVYDDALTPLADAYRACPPTVPHPGHVEHDAERLLEHVRQTAREALAKVGATRADAVGLANQGETAVAWDHGSGRPLAPAIVWQDRRTEPLLDALRRGGAAAGVERDSRLPLDPYFTSSKLQWLLAQPGVRAARERGTLRLGTSDAFRRARMTGEHATDPATASRTQLLDLHAVSWHPGLCDAFGVPVELLPAITPTCGPHGETDAGPLWAAVTDQQAALAGNGCFAPGEAKCTYGTGCFLLTNTGAACGDSSGGLLPTIAWQLDGVTTYATDGGVLSAASCLDWLVEIGVLSSARQADAVAGTVADAGGVCFLPALAGLGAPWWRSGSRGVFAGLSGATRPGHLVRAVLDALAFRVCDIVEAGRRSGVALDHLRADGGLTASAVLMQRQADVLGVPVHRAPDPELTALGAAALAGLGAGIIASTDAVVSRLAAPEVFTPRWTQDHRAASYAEWLAFLERSAALTGTPSAG